MSGTLYLRLGDVAASWIVRGAGEFRRMEQGDLAQAAAQAAGQRVVVLVPAAHVLLTEARLPPQQSRRLRQAVPFAIEEQLSDDVEQLHFALAAKRAADGAQPVAVVAHARMAQWLAQLEAAGLHPATLVPEVLALPAQEGEWTLLLDEEGALLRTGVTRGYALEPAAIDTLLGLALEQAGEGRPTRVRLFDCRHDASREQVHAACAAAGVEVVDGLCPEGSLALLADGLARPAAIDLLQGEFSRREHMGKLWRPWRFAAALLAVWVGLQLALGIYQYVQLSRESAQLQSEIEAVYRRAFPAARNISDPRMQMEQHLKQLRGGGGNSPFVALMARSAPVLRNEAGVQLHTLRYKDGVLELEVTVADFQAMDRLKQSLGEKGLQVEIQNAGARGGKTHGLLRLREAA